MATDSPEGGMVEDITFLKQALQELVDRVTALENKTPPDTTDIVDAVNAMHLQVFGVPAGKLQKLTD